VAYDVHAHCVPEEVVATLRRDGGRYGMDLVDEGGLLSVRIAGRQPIGPLRDDLSDADIDVRLAAMDRARVRMQLLSSWIDLTAYALDPSAGARYARMFNEALVGTVAGHPERFLGLCTVHDHIFDRALLVLEAMNGFGDDLGQLSLADVAGHERLAVSGGEERITWASEGGPAGDSVAIRRSTGPKSCCA
jgi:hypothetical protein